MTHRTYLCHWHAARLAAAILPVHDDVEHRHRLAPLGPGPHLGKGCRDGSPEGKGRHGRERQRKRKNGDILLRPLLRKSAPNLDGSFSRVSGDGSDIGVLLGDRDAGIGYPPTRGRCLLHTCVGLAGRISESVC